MPSLPHTSAYSRAFTPKELFLPTLKQCEQVSQIYGTPTIVYNERLLSQAARTFTNIPTAYGFTPRYAVKANTNHSLIHFMQQHGIAFDASSHWEVERLLHYGVPAKQILLTAQEATPAAKRLLSRGVVLNATSLKQLQLYAAASTALQHKQLSIRVNPGTSSSAAYKTNVAGSQSSFGIWHQDLPQATAIAAAHNAAITRLHVHFSSNTPAHEWVELSKHVITKIVPALPTVTTLNLGGGFAVARTYGEYHTQLPAIARVLRTLLRNTARTSGRQLTLELEPGAQLVANAATLICNVDDIVTTRGRNEQTFVKLNTGMNHLLRPALYGSEHYIQVRRNPRAQYKHANINAANKRSPNKLGAWAAPKVSAQTAVILVGNCCESGDLLTPLKGQPSTPAARVLGTLCIGDYVLITSVGAYVSSLANNYNSFPLLTECWLRTNGTFSLSRRRQSLRAMVQNEHNIFTE